jgi:hypothetical protein
MSLKKYLWILLLMLGFVPTGRAQSCLAGATFNVDAYTQYSMDANTTIHKTAILDGTITFPNGLSSGISGVYRRPQINSAFGPVSSSTSGSKLAVGNYMSIANSSQFVPAIGIQYTDDTDSFIESDCSWTGVMSKHSQYLSVVTYYHFQEHSPFMKYFEFAYSWVNKAGGGLGAGETWFYPVRPNCSNGTPDYDPYSVEVKSPTAAYEVSWIVGSFMARVHVTDTWTPIANFLGGSFFNVTINGFTYPVPPHACTHTGPQL